MRARFSAVVAVTILLAVAGWAIRKTASEDAGTTVLQHSPMGVMGTGCNLVLIADGSRIEAAQQGLVAAEAELRRHEALLSTWIESSPMSRFNAAPAGRPVEVVPEVSAVLALAQEFHIATGGAFDITARPLIELWRYAGDRGVLPSPAEIQTARAESSWNQIHRTANEVVKDLPTTRVDVDGIAKGFAIDRALEQLERSGALGGMVEVGGDLRLFGQGPTAQGWTVAIQSPFTDSAWAEVRLREGAVCTSGDYARFFTVEGRRFGHIIDPRSGWPTEQTHAVTVIGPEAAAADAWATALSILGVAGLELMKADSRMDAMVVSGTPDDFEVTATPGFRERLVSAVFDLSE